MSKRKACKKAANPQSTHTPPTPGSNPATLGPAVASNVETLKADLEEARQLAASYQAEIAGKDTQLARMTELSEMTRTHLIQLQLSVTNLRDERHRLANRAMEADALERKLTMVTIERDRLKEDMLTKRWYG